VQATVLREHVVGADGIGRVVGQPAGPSCAPGLLVGDCEVDQVAAGTKAGVGQVPERHRHRRREVEHVDGAATPHLAVDELTAERIPAPPVRVDGHDVGVAHQAQAGRGGIGALDARYERDPPRCRFVALHVEPRSLQHGEEGVRVADLLAGLR
jgi:hypothetical protein